MPSGIPKNPPRKPRKNTLPQVGNGRSPYQRKKTKAAFLSAFASCAIMHKSCEIARINVATVHYWLSTGFLQQGEIDAAYAAYQDRIRYVIHELAIEGTETPLNDGHGHVLLDSHGNVLTRNTKDVKILLQMAKTHLQEYKDNDNGHTSNVVNVNVGTMVNNPMYGGIDLHGWNLDDVHDLIAVVKRGESHKQLQAQHEHSQTTIIDSQ
jgi:hypothetical protein